VRPLLSNNDIAADTETAAQKDSGTTRTTDFLS